MSYHSKKIIYLQIPFNMSAILQHIQYSECKHRTLLISTVMTFAGQKIPPNLCNSFCLAPIIHSTQGIGIWIQIKLRVRHCVLIAQLSAKYSMLKQQNILQLSKVRLLGFFLTEKFLLLGDGNQDPQYQWLNSSKLIWIQLVLPRKGQDQDLHLLLFLALLASYGTAYGKSGFLQPKHLR